MNKKMHGYNLFHIPCGLYLKHPGAANKHACIEMKHIWKITDFNQYILLIPFVQHIKPYHKRHLFSYYYMTNDRLDLFWGYIWNFFSDMTGCLYIDQLRVI